MTPWRAGSPEASLRELLRGRSIYGDGCGDTFAPYRAELVSAPASAADAPTLASILPAEARRFLDGFSEQMLLTPGQYKQALDGASFRGPYWDRTRS